MLPLRPAMMRRVFPSACRSLGPANLGLATPGPLRFSKKATYPAVLPQMRSISPSPSQSKPTGVASAPNFISSACCLKYLGGRNSGVRSSVNLPVFSMNATRPSSSPTTRSSLPSLFQSNATGVIISRSMVSGRGDPGSCLASSDAFQAAERVSLVTPSGTVRRRPAAYLGSVRDPMFSK